MVNLPNNMRCVALAYSIEEADTGTAAPGLPAGQKQRLEKVEVSGKYFIHQTPAAPAASN